MKRLGVMLGVVLLCSGLAWAQPVVSTTATPSTGTAVALAPEGAVGNNPTGAVTLVKAFAEYTQPAYEGIWNWRDGSVEQGVSGSLWNFSSNTIQLASLRLGAATSGAIYGGLKFDLPGLTKRYVPASVKGVATAGVLATLWNVVGNYATLGPVVGYSFDDHAAIYGMSFGASVRF